MERSNVMEPLLHLREKPAQSRADSLFQKIENMILSGELLPGYIFPNENVMCEELSVGRSTLREAYKALSLFGYVTRSKRGTIVNDKKHIINSMPLNITLQRSSKSDLAEFRLMLESETAWYAARRSSKKNIETMRQILAEMENAFERDDMEYMANMDIAFHLEIAKATQNQLFEDTMIAASSIWEAGVADNYRIAHQRGPDMLKQTLAQHRLLLDAFENHDEEMALIIIKRHVETVSGLESPDNNEN